jgi:uncharacterized protein (UPF0332 family)
VKPEVEGFLAKAEESLAAARMLSKEGSHGFSASRAYYGMFYAAEALLLTKGLAYSSHSAVLAAFGREFIKPGRLDPKWHRALHEVFQVRQVGDYEPLEQVSEETARRTLEEAEGFVQAIRIFLSSEVY